MVVAYFPPVRVIWPILLGRFPGQIKGSESQQNFLFLRIFRAGRTYFPSTLFKAAEPLHREESDLIYGPLSLPS